MINRRLKMPRPNLTLAAIALMLLGSLGIAGYIQSSVVSGGGGASTFDQLGTGVNTTATMTAGTGATVTFSGSGVVNASQLGGTAAASYAKLANTALTGNTSVAQLSYASLNAIGNSGASKTVNWSTGGNVQSITINQSTTLAWTAPPGPSALTLEINNTGAFTVALPTMKWSGGVVPTVTSGTATDILSMFYDGTNYYAAISIPNAQ